jgi:hypothetical protein
VALLALCITINQLAADRLDNWLSVSQSLLVTYAERVKVSPLLLRPLKAFKHGSIFYLVARNSSFSANMRKNTRT